MTLMEESIKLEKDFQETTGSKWEIRNAIYGLLEKQRNRYKKLYIDACCNPDFKGNKMNYIFNDN